MIWFSVNSAELRKILRQRKMSISDGAKFAEIPLSTMYKLVQKEGSHITLKTLSRLTSAFGSSVVTEKFSYQDFFNAAKSAGFELVSTQHVVGTPEFGFEIMTFCNNEASAQTYAGELTPPF